MSNVYLTGFVIEREETPQGLARAGDVVHFRISGTTAFGRAWSRGEEHTLTPADIGNTINKHSESWLDRELANPDGKVALGPWPSDEPILLPGSVEFAEERERRRREAHAKLTVAERVDALAKVIEDFGQAGATSSTINRAADPTIRAATEQERRIRDAALRQVSKYAPARREV